MTKTNNERRSGFERFLSLFTELRAGEGVVAALMFLNIFLILNAYYVLKPIRDGLIVGDIELFGIEGDELKSYLSAFMAFLLIFVVKSYGSLASKVTRIKLLNITGILVVVCVCGFFVAGKILKISGVPIAITYFVWLGIVNVFLIAQFWSYANDIYSEQQGKRLFPFIAIGMATGAILGAFITRQYGEEHMWLLLLGAGAMLGFCQLLYNGINHRVARLGTSGEQEQEQQQQQQKKEEAEQPLSKEGGFKLVFQSKYLLLIAFMILVANLVNTTGEFIISNAAKNSANEQYPDDMYTTEWVANVEAGKATLPPADEKVGPRVIEAVEKREKARGKARKGYITSFYGTFYGLVNLFVFLIQAFIVSRFFKYLGVRAALFALPIVATLGNLGIAVIGTLQILRISKIAENATDYSLQNTLRQALFLPTSREVKYKAKAAIDTFFVRLGDALSAGLVLVGIHALAFGRSSFAAVNVGLCVVWVLICLGIAREHKKLVPDDSDVDA